MTKEIIKVLLITFIFQNCQYKNEDKPNNKNRLKNTVKKIEPKLFSDSKSIKPTKIIDKDSCECNWIQEKLDYHTDLTFSNNSKPFNLDSLKKWVNNSDRLNIKSLTLIDFDTIPLGMSMFKNVESIYLRALNHKNVQGLEIFPNLRILKIQEERFQLSENTKWIKNIEVIHANKTRFSGLKSFNQMPNIKEVRLNFSGFTPFPQDFNNLKCLSYFQIRSSVFSVIDLTQLDFSSMACLKYVEFHSWGSIKGTPNGIEKIKTVKINHLNLTKQEKKD